MSEEQPHSAEIEQQHLQQGEISVANVRINDLRLLELGMAVQRGQPSCSTLPTAPATPTASDMSTKLDGVASGHR